MLGATSTSVTTAVWYTIRATGVMALVLLTVTTVLGLLSSSRVHTRRWPAFAQVDLHRWASLLALVFLGLHVVTAVVDTYVRVGVLSAVVPFVSPFKTFWTGLGTLALDLLLAVAISSALRQRIAARTWQRNSLVGLRVLAARAGPLPRLGHRCSPAVDGRHCGRLFIGGGRRARVSHRLPPERPTGAGAGRSRHPVRSDHHPNPREEPTMTTATTFRTERLLRSDPDGNVGPGLAAHLAVHGPLTVPAGDDPNWRRAVWNEVAASGLSGRGGGGFPAAAKWDTVARSGRRPLVVVNAMEGEPASAKDRVLLSRAPHLVLDGAEVAAATSGAREIVVCVPDDRDDTARSLQRALAERELAGGFRRASVARPPARFVTGEESALVAWLDHRDARPVLRVDKSVPLRLGRRPVLVHNAETLAQVALVARHGSAWFRSVGSPEAPGSTLVTVSGAVHAPGVVEIALGTPVEELIAGAGPIGEPAGLLVGGYGGAWLHPDRWSVPFAPGPLTEAGATLGVGIVVVLGSTSCGIAETARIARYLAAESAGQCGPCVYGLPAVAEDLELLAAGRARCLCARSHSPPLRGHRRAWRLSSPGRSGPVGPVRPHGVCRRRS